MSLGLLIYNILGGFVFLVGFPFLILYNLAQGQYSDRLVERLGRYPRSLRPDSSLTRAGPIWIHAVSVGEVKAAAALAERLKEQLPDIPLLFSTTTPAGRQTAEKLLGDEIPLVYYPLDFSLCVKRALKFFHPRAFVALETELWPNFLFQAHKSGCKLILVNGRISRRSFKRYSKVHWLFGPLLRKFQILMVRHPDDGRYLISLGAGPDQVRILGNIKYDGLLGQDRDNLKTKAGQRLNLPAGVPVLVAGSTRSGEEAILLTVYDRLRMDFPDLVLILAPRHINRCAEIEDLVKRRGFAYRLFSQGGLSGGQGPVPVILVDTIGDLFGLYGLADLAFCGGSLVPKGGQNILEPAAWGKLVFYGPYMEDFKDARDLLEKSGAGIQVADEIELYEQMRYFLRHPEEGAQKGEAGRQALKSQTGITKKAAEVIAETIKESGFEGSRGRGFK